MKPKFDRISPIAGFKRIYGKEAIVQFLKGLIKIALVGAAVSMVLWSERGALLSLPQVEREAFMPITMGSC